MRTLNPYTCYRVRSPCGFRYVRSFIPQSDYRIDCIFYGCFERHCVSAFIVVPRPPLFVGIHPAHIVGRIVGLNSHTSYVKELWPLYTSPLFVCNFRRSPPLHCALWHRFGLRYVKVVALSTAVFSWMRLPLSIDTACFSQAWYLVSDIPDSFVVRWANVAKTLTFIPNLFSILPNKFA